MTFFGLKNRGLSSFLGAIRRCVASRSRGLILLLITGETHWVRCWLSSTRETGTYWSNSREGPQRCLRDWSMCVTTRGWKTGTVQPEAQKAQGIWPMCVNTNVMRRVKKGEPDSSQWCPVTGQQQWAQAEIQGTGSKHNTFLLWR